MPYRIDISSATPHTLDRLVELGALDIEPVGSGLAAILPDAVKPDAVAQALGIANLAISPAISRDNGSVWILNPGTIRIGSILIAPPEVVAPNEALRLSDSTAFGTGYHPTTALCIEALEELLNLEVPGSVLDVGTGSGILALAALKMGVARVVGLDIDAGALKIAEEHARLNNLRDRFDLVLGGPDAVTGTYGLVVANVLAAALIDMAPTLVRRVGSGGRLILSGIPWSLESEVRRAYQQLGMRHIRSETRDTWTVLVVQASW